jgi:kinetochore protein NDC80
MERVQHRTEMWAEYLSTSYPEFLAHEDYDIENQKRKLEDRYEASGEQTKADVMRHTEEEERLKAEYKALCQESVSTARPTFFSLAERFLQHHLDKYRHEQKKLDSDIVHMEGYLGRLESGVKKSATRCEEFRKKIADLEQQEKAVIAEREQCMKTVEQQNLSEVDIHRLTTDRQTLDAKLRAARQEREEKSRRSYDLEIKRTQAYNTIERLVEEYEARAAKVGLMPVPPSGYEHIDFHQELTGSAATASAMVPDCTTTIKPAIARLRQDTLASRRVEDDKALTVEEVLADIRDRTQNKIAECEEVEARYTTLQAELTAGKEVCPMLQRISPKQKANHAMS